MKKNFFTLLIAVLVLSITANAQDCFKFMPQKEGSVMKIKNFDKDKRETGTSTLTILKRTKNGNQEQLDVQMESKDAKTDSIYKMDFSYICKDGKMYVDMKSYLGNQLASYQGMEMQVDAGELEIPTDPKAGQVLPGGTVQVSIMKQGFAFMKIGVTVSNRKIEKIEKITTDAGTFECFKITQDTESKIGFVKVKGSSAEWISDGAGVVRSENYDKKGNLVSYSVLVELKK